MLIRFGYFSFRYLLNDIWHIWHGVDEDVTVSLAGVEAPELNGFAQ